MGVLDAWNYEFEELQPTQEAVKPKLRLLVLDFLFSDRHFDLLDGPNDVLVEHLDEN